jgi:hypothetical protein
MHSLVQQKQAASDFPCRIAYTAKPTRQVPIFAVASDAAVQQTLNRREADALIIDRSEPCFGL